MIGIHILNRSPIGKISFPFGALLGQDMTVISMFPFQLSGTGEPETFLGPGI
jgi:hypothetical protein